MRVMNRRDVLKLAGAAGVAATGPWWRVGRSQAQRYIDRRKDLYPTLARHAQLDDDRLAAPRLLAGHTRPERQSSPSAYRAAAPRRTEAVGVKQPG